VLVSHLEIVNSDWRNEVVLLANVSEDVLPVAIHLDYEFFELLLVNLEVFHDHVVAEVVALIEVLPVVKHVIAVLLGLTVLLDD
jgi:hypothetical protein